MDFAIVWSVVEQLFIAGVDIGDDEVTQSTLKMLLMKFPKSARVARLRGIMAEISGMIIEPSAVSGIMFTIFI
jgi:hypothetical protein